MKEWKRGERPKRERHETAGREGGRAQLNSRGGEEQGRKEEKEE